MIKLWHYFGIIGYASIIAWIVAAAVMFRNLNGPDRTRRFWQAFAIAAFGLLLANWNSVIIFAIQPDMTAELKSQEERKERMEKHAEELAAAEGEDGETGETGETGSASTSQPVTVSATNVAAHATGTNDVPLYRRTGKVERSEGKKIKDKALERGAEVEKEERVATRKMKPLALWWANRYNVMNLFFARLTFWATLIAVLCDYLVRFNSTRDSYCPMPITYLPFSRWIIDAICQKTLSVRVQHAGKETICAYLERAFVKGESFIYFGETSPWPRINGGAPAARPGRYLTRVCPDSDKLSVPRLRVQDPRPWLLDLSVKGLREVGSDHVAAVESCLEKIRPFDARLWSRPILHFPDRSADIHPNFAFESAWFGRYPLVVNDAELAGKWLEDLTQFLDTRVQVLASARRTVNVVWDLDQPIPEDRLKELLFLCSETNYKFLLIGKHRLSEGMEERFEEKLDDLAAPVAPDHDVGVASI
jgi:hypothetical protein